MMYIYPVVRFLGTIFLFTLLLLVGSAPLEAQIVDGSFEPIVSSAGIGTGVVVQPDNKLLVAGTFTSVGGTATDRVVRLMPDGAVDPSFALDSDVQGGVSGISLRDDGRILLRGTFFNQRGDTLGDIIRLLPEGSLDPSFTAIREDGRSITDFVSLPNGKILTSNYRCIPNQPVNCGAAGIKMYTKDGLADTAFPAVDFPPNYDGTLTINVDALAVQSDNAILVGGSNLPYGDRTQNVYRFDSLGQVDPTFDPPVASFSNFLVGDIDVQPDGSIGILGAAGYGVTLLDSTGAVRFSGDLQPNVNAGAIIASTAGNYILLGERITLIDGRDGQVLDLIGGVSEGRFVLDAKAQAGAVVAVGNFSDANGVTTPGILRVLGDEFGLRVDETFTAALYRPGYVAAVIPQDDGRVVLAGDFIAVNGQPLRHLARLNADGSVDSEFDDLGRPTERPFYAGAAALSDGRIVAAGLGGGGVEAIVLLDRDGNDLGQFFPFDTDFTEPNVTYLEVDEEDRIYAGSGTAVTNGTDSYQEAYRYTLDGQGGGALLDYGISLIDSLERYNGFIPQGDGKLLFYGSQIKAGGNAPAALVRALSDGSVDPDFQAELPDNFYTVRAATLASGNIVVAGGDLNNRRLENQRFLKLDTAGARLPDFEFRVGRGDGRGFSIFSLLQLNPETLLLTGGFDRYNEISVPSGRVLIDTAGNFLQVFLPRLNPGALLLTAATYEDQVYLGGRFSLARGANSIVRLNSLLSAVPNRATDTGGLSVWPNPLSGGQLYVRLDRQPQARELSYRFYLLASGQLISAGTVPVDDQLAIPVPDQLARGAYMVTLTDGATTWSARVIR